jgi:hypothetical protein
VLADAGAYPKFARSGFASPLKCSAIAASASLPTVMNQVLAMPFHCSMLISLVGCGCDCGGRTGRMDPVPLPDTGGSA